jgi:hypothetical protein
MKYCRSQSERAAIYAQCDSHSETLLNIQKFYCLSGNLHPTRTSFFRNVRYRRTRAEMVVCNDCLQLMHAQSFRASSRTILFHSHIAEVSSWIFKLQFLYQHCPAASRSSPQNRKMFRTRCGACVLSEASSMMH